jgi:hypothetical protein
MAAAVRPDWARVDAVWEALAREHSSHLRRQSGLEPRDFLVEAFSAARELKFLRAFAVQLVKEDLIEQDVTGFNRHLEAILGQSIYGQQSWVNGVFGAVDARIAGRGLLRACDYVCRIDIDGQQVGTGVLVGPVLVATAAHVVLPLTARAADGSLEVAADGTLHAAPDTLGRLTLTFGDALDVSPDGGEPTRQTGKLATLHPDWLYWASQPTALEQSRALFDVHDVDGIAMPDGPWDLAVIRLAQPLELPAPPELVREPPGSAFAVHVLHHPHGTQQTGQPMVWSIGQLDVQLGTPPIRYLHDANTLEGSSGAPLFDQRWRVVGVHQAGARVVPQAQDAAGLDAAARNRAVPIRHLCDRLDRMGPPPADNAPVITYLQSATDLNPYPYPVIGRRRTQDSLWRGMRTDAPAADRLLIVRGAPGTGKRFTKRLVREYLEAHRAAVVTLDLANVLTDDAASFARRIAGAMSVAVPEPAGERVTTAPWDARREVAPALGRTWQELARRRAVWLVLEGFAGASLDVPTAVSDVVTAIVRQLPEYPLLRLILVGWMEAPPPGLEKSIEDLAAPTADDVAAHFLPPGEPSDPEVVALAARLLTEAHAEGLAGYDAAHRVVATIATRLATAMGGGR